MSKVNENINEATNLVIKEHREKHYAMRTDEWNAAYKNAIDALQELWELNRDGKDVRK